MIKMCKLRFPGVLGDELAATLIRPGNRLSRASALIAVWASRIL